MSALTPAALLTALSVVVALLGVIVLMVTIYEYTRLRTLRKEFYAFERRWHDELELTQKALQRVIASYNTGDTQAQIQLLESAVAIDPKVFNGYNSLGYAYMDQGNLVHAADVFKEAIHHHPEQIEGYCDLARCYLRLGEQELARQYLAKAQEIDAEGVRKGLRGDEELENLC